MKIAEAVKGMTARQAAIFLKENLKCSTCDFDPDDCKVECATGHIDWFMQEVEADGTKKN